MRILSPLADLNFTKTVIKYTASSLGLRCATQPSTTCFASRFEPNVVITREKIERVAEGEAFLRRFLPEEADLRLRVHDNIARIKVQPEYFSFLLEQRQRILDLLNALGFRYVTLDLAGF